MQKRGKLFEVFAPEGSALDLAVLRISVALVLAWNESVVLADTAAALPIEARVAPTGVGWLVPLLPITPALVRAVRVVLWAACATSALGLFSRASFTIAALTASYVMLAPQLTGAVFHDHHLLWLAALLAVSPCGDALSIDAWLARRRGAPRPTRGRAHGAAIRVAWLFIGCVFFFPGLHKLLTSGLAWVTSDNLRNQMWWKWAQDPATEPSFRIDRHPMLLHVLAGGTIAFELSFFALVLANRWTRLVAVIGALVFHQATDYFMGVRFPVLWLTYGMFVPWEQLVRKLAPSKPPPRAREDVEVHAPASTSTGAGGSPRHARDEPCEGRIAAPFAFVSALLLVGITSFGALGIVNGYPFACFPTFEWMPDDEMPALELEIERADGTTQILDRALWRDVSPREWALEWSVAGVYDRFDQARATAYYRARVQDRPALARAVEEAAVVRFSRAYLSVDPDHRYEVQSRELLGELRL